MIIFSIDLDHSSKGLKIIEALILAVLANVLLFYYVSDMESGGADC
jgi:hypothetical protein